MTVPMPGACAEPCFKKGVVESNIAANNFLQFFLSLFSPLFFVLSREEQVPFLSVNALVLVENDKFC